MKKMLPCGARKHFFVEISRKLCYAISAAERRRGTANNGRRFFFFKQKTAYEMHSVTGVQTCALPISPRGAPQPETFFVAAAQPAALLFQVGLCVVSGEKNIVFDSQKAVCRRHTAFCRFRLLHFACFHSKIKCTAIVFCKNAAMADSKSFTADAAPL